MNTHNFLISTTRPELLERQISSFSDVRQNRRLNFYIFNDTDDKSGSKKFSRVVTKLRTKLSEITLHYFDLDDQISILQKIAFKYSSILKIDAEQILDCFKENGKLRGIRSIQNKSIAIFYSINRDREGIVHRIDDDIFPYEADRQGDVVKIIVKNDFFRQKELSLDNNMKIFSGSNYTIDSPSPLVNYADFTEFVRNFYILAQKKSENDKIGDDILMMAPSKVRNVVDPLNVLDILPINENFTYGEAINLLEKHVVVLLNGNSRVIINDNGENRDGVDKFFPGGCVSFLYSNIPTLTPAFGNQDLLWELIELLDGKTLVSSGYIGHIKSINDRPSIIDDLKDSSYKHQTSLTYSAYQFLVERHENKKQILNFQENFIDLMSKWLEESSEYTEQVLKLIGNRDNWYSDESKYTFTLLIKRICSDFISHYKEIKNNYLYASQDVVNLMSSYYKSKKIFDNLLEHIVNTN